MASVLRGQDQFSPLAFRAFPGHNLTSQGLFHTRLLPRMLSSLPHMKPKKILQGLVEISPPL